MAPLTLYSSNEKPTPERSRKMRGQLLWCLRGSVCASQNHLTSNCFANSRHCLGRMRCEEKRKESARASTSEVLMCAKDGARAFCGAGVPSAAIRDEMNGSRSCCCCAFRERSVDLTASEEWSCLFFFCLFSFLITRDFAFSRTLT